VKRRRSRKKGLGWVGINLTTTYLPGWLVDRPNWERKNRKNRLDQGERSGAERSGEFITLYQIRPDLVRGD